MTLRYSAAVFALGVETYVFCLGSCRSTFRGVNVALFHSAGVLLFLEAVLLPGIVLVAVRRG